MENKTSFKGERINIDITHVNTPSYGGAKFWMMIQDDFTDYVWSFFLKEKSQLADVFMKWLNTVQKETKLKIGKIRCDNSGENRKLQGLIQMDSKLKIKFEFTAPYTPQQNGKIERKFSTLYGKIRSMLNWARLTKHLQTKLWAQAASTVTRLENIIIKGETNKTSYERFYGKTPDWAKYLRTFGEVAIVQDGTKDKIRGKLTNRGMPCIFIGYPEDHAPSVYQFLKLDTQTMILSRNYNWLNQSYGEYKNLDVHYVKIRDIERSQEISDYQIKDHLDEFEILEDEEIFQEEIYGEAGDQIEFVPDAEETSESTETESEESDEDYDDAVEEEAQPRTRISGVNRALRNLETYYNPNPQQYLEDAANIMKLNHSERLLVANIHDGNPEPKTVFEAKQTKDWNKWWEAISIELKNMEEKEVWEIHEKKNLPTGRKLIGNRWVFALKDDGRYRARTVAKGFSQIPGKDFQENFAPVINDATFHLILALKEMMSLEAGQFDIETAFLYGELDEELWMQLPEGYSEYVKEKSGRIISPATHCVKLTKALYGLVQAACQWWKKFKEVMKQLKYIPSEVDPCLFIKDKGNNQKSFVIIYVDDGGIFGTNQDIKETLQALGKTFKVKDLGPMKHFVGCHIMKDGKKNGLYIHQPKLLKHLDENFGKLIGEISRTYRTPAGPKTTIMRPEKGDTLISVDKQTTYRSGVGMLLYLVKHSRPEISNAVRELSKVGDGATQAHWKALMRTIKFVLDTRKIGLKILPHQYNGNYILEGISDSEYAGDKDTRISVYGYIIYFCGVPVAWKSKSGKSVTLSSTEAEYFAISEVAKEIIFLKQVIESMGMKLQLPIVIKVDNVGAIYLSNNYTTSQRTKHIDIRTHFVRQYIEDGIIKIVFVKSEDNDADIFTKNTTEEIYEKQANKIVEEIKFMK